MDSSDHPALPGPQELAETYTGGYHDDPWAIVRQYQEYQDLVAANPDAGSYAVASTINAPRGRVRSWNDGAVPDAVRGVTTAQNRGWLPLSLDSEAFAALNLLVAATFAGGSINENWAPSWHVDSDETEQRIDDALHDLGLRSRVSRRGESGRATEIAPRQDASVLGRLLVTMGAPRGAKSSTSTLSLPSYIMAAPPERREDWVRIYLRMRGTLVAEERRPGSWLRFREERPTSYLDALAALIRLVLPVGDEDVTVRQSGENLFVSRAAVVALFGSDRPWHEPEPA